MGSNNYVRSQSYEFFIRHAWLCERDEFGARDSYMINLMEKETGSNSVAHLKHEKLLADVKKYMTSATKFAIKRSDVGKADKQHLQSYLARNEDAITSDKLLEISEEGKELLLKYRPN